MWGYTGLMLRAAMARGHLQPEFRIDGLGAVTNFFDTLGIGSFAPTTAWLKLRALVPDRFIPATLNAGHCIPTIVQALVFIRLVQVDPLLLVACIVAAMAGSFVGTAMALRVSTRVVQGTVGVALIIAAGLYAMQNLNLMPNNGNALTLVPLFFVLAVAAHFVLGSLMAFGIGLYAPSLVTLSLMGLDPKAAFPIMMGACAFLMPVTGLRFSRDARVDLRIVLGVLRSAARRRCCSQPTLSPPCPSSRCAGASWSSRFTRRCSCCAPRPPARPKRLSLPDVVSKEPSCACSCLSSRQRSCR